MDSQLDYSSTEVHNCLKGVKGNRPSAVTCTNNNSVLTVTGGAGSHPGGVLHSAPAKRFWLRELKWSKSPLWLLRNRWLGNKWFRCIQLRWHTPDSQITLLTAMGAYLWIGSCSLRLTRQQWKWKLTFFFLFNFTNFLWWWENAIIKTDSDWANQLDVSHRIPKTMTHQAVFLQFSGASQSWMSRLSGWFKLC